MRDSRSHQPLTYDVRLPDEAQADALRLLDESKAVVNAALALLWPHLDEFATDRVGPAWKQVGKYIASPSPHGDRQWRCESEVVGRVFVLQAERKSAFELIEPILSDGFIRPETDKRPAGKNRPAIKEAITTLQKSLEEDETSFVALQNVVEQCCNYYFQLDQFPPTYERPSNHFPFLKVGMLTYAGDDGGAKGQAYRLSLDVDAGRARFRFRYPDEAGVWHWRKVDTLIPLPDCLKERLSDGELLAPTLREERRADGERFAVLDFIIEVEQEELAAWESVERVLGADWGVHSLLTATAVDKHSSQVGRPFWLNTGAFDGRQARTRRQIDELQKKVATYEQLRDALLRRSPETKPGTSRGLRSTVGRLIGVGASMNAAIAHWPIWQAMCCCFCVSCMAARCFRWNRCKRSNRRAGDEAYEENGEIIATTRRSAGKSGGYCATNAI